jgi:hypothetical protein
MITVVFTWHGPGGSSVHGGHDPMSDKMTSVSLGKGGKKLL